MFRWFTKAGVILVLVLFSAGSVYAAKPGERIGDWFYNCTAGSKTKKRLCYISQTSEKKVGKRSARLLTVNIGNVFADGKVWMVALLPWETWQTAVQKPLVVDVDGRHMFKARFDTCFRAGCRVRVLLNGKVIQAFRKGRIIGLSFKDIRGRNIRIEVSLRGFSKAMKVLR